MKPPLPELIRQKRNVRSLRVAAEESGISEATLSRLERGGVPSARVMEKLTAWLGLEMETNPPAEWRVEALMRQADVVERELTTLRVMIGALLD